MVLYYNYFNIIRTFVLKIYFLLFCFLELNINNFLFFIYYLRIAEIRVGMSLLTMLIRVHEEDIILLIKI